MTIQARINKLKSRLIKGMIIASPLLPVQGSAQTQQGFDEIKEKTELSKKLTPEEFAEYKDEECFGAEDWKLLNEFFSEEKTKHIKYESFNNEDEGKKEIFYINYDPYTGTAIEKESFDNTKVKEYYLNAQKEIFSKPTEIRVLPLNLTNDIHYDNGIYFSSGTFEPDTNILTLYEYHSDNPKNDVKTVMSLAQCSEEKATDFINYISKLFSRDCVESFKEHELSHRDDHVKNLFIPDLPNEYMKRLRILSEIKASLAQAGLAFQKYKNDGNVSHFATKSEVDTLALQKELPKIKDEKQQGDYIVSYIYNQWLETYNQKDSPYMTEINGELGDYHLKGYGFRASVAPNEENKEEYLRRAREMFSDVPYWGDLSKVIDYNFELQDNNSRGLKAPILYDLTVGCKTNAEALSRLTQFLDVVEKCDKNGERTNKDQQEIARVYNHLVNGGNGQNYASMLQQRDSY